LPVFHTNAAAAESGTTRNFDVPNSDSGDGTAVVRAAPMEPYRPRIPFNRLSSDSCNLNGNIPPSAYAGMSFAVANSVFFLLFSPKTYTIGILTSVDEYEV
jgi:hypothetical protein